MERNKPFLLAYSGRKRKSFRLFRVQKCYGVDFGGLEEVIHNLFFVTKR